MEVLEGRRLDHAGNSRLYKRGEPGMRSEGGGLSFWAFIRRKAFLFGAILLDNQQQKPVKYNKTQQVYKYNNYKHTTVACRMFFESLLVLFLVREAAADIPE